MHSPATNAGADKQEKKAAQRAATQVGQVTV
jgi:hypothetical protein